MCNYIELLNEMVCCLILVGSIALFIKIGMECHELALLFTSLEHAVVVRQVRHSMVSMSFVISEVLASHTLIK